MFSRKDRSDRPKDLKGPLKSYFENILSEFYQKECSAYDRDFKVYGQIFNDEIVLAISWMHRINFHLSPLTLYISCDIHQAHKKSEIKAFNDMLDFGRHIFEGHDLKSPEYILSWQKETYEGHSFFYRTCRENIELILEANKYLEDYYPL